MKHDLTDSQLSSTFTTDIKPWLDARGHTVEAPTAHAIIGQPGSGTNALIDSTRRDDPTTLAVRRDDLRQFHPNYNDLLADSPQAMPAATLQAADQWQAMSLKHAAEQNYSVVWDSDTTNPNALNSQLAQFRQHGFDTSATAIAEPRELSLLSTVERYSEQQAQGAAAWVTPSNQHDQAYDRAALALEHANNSDTTITVVNRQHDIIYSGSDPKEATAGLRMGRQLKDDYRRDAEARIAPVREHLSTHSIDDASAQAVNNLHVVDSHTQIQPDSPTVQLNHDAPSHSH